MATPQQVAAYKQERDTPPEWAWIDSAGQVQAVYTGCRYAGTVWPAMGFTEVRVSPQIRGQVSRDHKLTRATVMVPQEPPEDGAEPPIVLEDRATAYKPSVNPVQPAPSPDPQAQVKADLAAAPTSDAKLALLISHLGLE